MTDTSRVDRVRQALMTWGRNDTVVQQAAARPIRVVMSKMTSCSPRDSKSLPKV